MPLMRVRSTNLLLTVQDNSSILTVCSQDNNAALYEQPGQQSAQRMQIDGHSALSHTTQQTQNGQARMPKYF